MHHHPGSSTLGLICMISYKTFECSSFKKTLKYEVNLKFEDNLNIKDDQTKTKQIYQTNPAKPILSYKTTKPHQANQAYRTVQIYKTKAT